MHRLDQISAKKPAKLPNSKSLTLYFSRRKIADEGTFLSHQRTVARWAVVGQHVSAFSTGSWSEKRQPAPRRPTDLRRRSAPFCL